MFQLLIGNMCFVRLEFGCWDQRTTFVDAFSSKMYLYMHLHVAQGWTFRHFQLSTLSFFQSKGCVHIYKCFRFETDLGGQDGSYRTRMSQRWDIKSRKRTGLSAQKQQSHKTVKGWSTRDLYLFPCQLWWFQFKKLIQIWKPQTDDVASQELVGPMFTGPSPNFSGINNLHSLESSTHRISSVES